MPCLAFFNLFALRTFLISSGVIFLARSSCSLRSSLDRCFFVVLVVVFSSSASRFARSSCSSSPRSFSSSIATSFFFFFFIDDDDDDDEKDDDDVVSSLDDLEDVLPSLGGVSISPPFTSPMVVSSPASFF